MKDVNATQTTRQAKRRNVDFITSPNVRSARTITAVSLIHIALRDLVVPSLYSPSLFHCPPADADVLLGGHCS